MRVKKNKIHETPVGCIYSSCKYNSTIFFGYEVQWYPQPRGTILSAVRHSFQPMQSLYKTSIVIEIPNFQRDTQVPIVPNKKLRIGWGFLAFASFNGLSQDDDHVKVYADGTWNKCKQIEKRKLGALGTKAPK